MGGWVDGMMGDVPVRQTTTDDDDDDDGRRAAGVRDPSVPRVSAHGGCLARARRLVATHSRWSPPVRGPIIGRESSSCFGRLLFLSSTDGLKRKTIGEKGSAEDAGVTEVSRDAEDGEERTGVARGDAGTANRGVAGRSGRRRRRGLRSSSGETEARVRR
jgi:hypothetical protein